MEQLLENIFAIEVPEDAHQFHVMNFGKPPTLSYDYSVVKSGAGSAGLTAMENLPPGSYEILFTTKDCTEEQAAAVVPVISNKGKLVCYEDYEESLWFNTATSSLRSLLRSKNLDPAKNYLLIKSVAQKEDK